MGALRCDAFRRAGCVYTGVGSGRAGPSLCVQRSRPAVAFIRPAGRLQRLQRLISMGAAAALVALIRRDIGAAGLRACCGGGGSNSYFQGARRSATSRWGRHTRPRPCADSNPYAVGRHPLASKEPQPRGGRQPRSRCGAGLPTSLHTQHVRSTWLVDCRYRRVCSRCGVRIEQPSHQHSSGC